MVNTAKDTARERLIRVGREVAVLANDEDGATELIHNYRQEGINVYVLSKDGNVLLPSNGEKWNGDITEIVEKLNKADKETAPVIYTKDHTLNYVMFLDHGEGSYLIASYSLSIFNSSVRILLTYFIIVGVTVILLTAMVAYNVSQKLSSGLKNLSSTAVRFSEGDFNVNFANAEYQELADLSDTLNSVRDEVKKSGDFQRELIANVSHDLKTPLTMIKAYASMIREISGDNPEKRDKHLQVIIDEADRLTGLVNDVLNVSKVSSKLDEINFKVFNLTEFLFGIINKFDYLQETQGYSFMVDVDPNLYTRADEEKIGQVIYNLLSNAINYTGADKTVYISLKSNIADERIKLTIKDTGKGISKQDLPEIWNRYYRVKENHARPVKGTGLGLSIVKIILQNHSFDFGVESEIGKGSSFWVDFPAVPEKIEEE
ncbi:MAG: HAMP domain-containing histidine kinase [Clostridia bacterium]|nr:HAMP domain-containing histidine kinase [Clostridia bacterium]